MLQCSVTNHRMIVLKDEGLYRHVRFQEPGTSIWRFDLVTWPGHLVITGDLEDYHFARISDMFEFFRSPVGHINEQYWAEKLQGPVRETAKKFSTDTLKRRVYEHFRESQEWVDRPHAPIWKAIREEVLDGLDEIDENEAHRRLNNFQYYHPEPPPEPAKDFVPQWMSRARRRGSVHPDYEFTDSWEWDLREWGWHFQIALHAIVWGINQWDTKPHVSEAQWLRKDLAEARKYLRDLGDDEKGHIVRIDSRGFFNSKHPLHERANDDLLECSIHNLVTAWLDTKSFAERQDLHDTVWRISPEGEWTQLVKK
jgi:hypothetical protein